MKKILALLLASLLLIGLFAGCAKQETAPVQQEQTTTTEPAPAEQPAEQAFGAAGEHRAPHDHLCPRLLP